MRKDLIAVVASVLLAFVLAGQGNSADISGGGIAGPGSTAAQHQKYADMLAWVLQVKWNATGKGTYKFTNTECRWTPYKFRGNTIFVCHTTETLLKQHRKVTGYFYVNTYGAFITQKQAHNAAEANKLVA